MFIDEAKIYVKAGKGGDGSASFRREKNVPNGGPDGGNGGRGGNVIIKASSSLSSLLDFKYKTKYVAQNGANGTHANRDGKNGEDLIISVPVGTMIIDENNTETNHPVSYADTPPLEGNYKESDSREIPLQWRGGFQDEAKQVEARRGGYNNSKSMEKGIIIADLKTNNDNYTICHGGAGGKGNNYFKNAVRQAPTFATMGRVGEEREIRLELKLLADVGIIGFPSVGKSTFISVVSNAKPKIADYEFTTLIPNLGVVKHNDVNLVFADMPGLIEGAHVGIGLGIQFLKHIERCKVFLHIIDGFNDDETIEKNYNIINSELEKFDKALLNRPQIIAINKKDVNPNLGDIAKKLGAYTISCATHEGIDELLDKIFEVAKNVKNIDTEISEDIFFDRTDNQIEIFRKDDVFIVKSKQIESIVNNLDLDNPEGLAYFRRIMREKAIERLLKDEGATIGDEIIIGKISFELE